MFEKIKNNKVTAIGLGIGTAIIAIGTFFDAVGTIFSPIIEKEEIITSLSLASYNEEKVKEVINLENSYGEFKYVENNNGHILPESEYLQNFNNREILQLPDLGYYEKPSFKDLHFPTLDFKIINNTTKTIVADKLILNVLSSKPDNRPLLYICTTANDFLNLKIINEGWGDWSKCLLEFNIQNMPSDKTNFSNRNSKYIFSAQIPFFEGEYNLDLTTFFAEKGVDVDYVKQKREEGIWANYSQIDQFKRALNGLGGYEKHGGLYCFVEGKLTLYGEKVQTNNFIGTILLTSPELGGALEIYDKYDLHLKSKGANYTVEYPISISLQPNEAERVLITLSSDQSSHHKFKVELRNINNQKLKSEIVNLELFLPKTSAEMFNKSDLITFHN